MSKPTLKDMIAASDGRVMLASLPKRLTIDEIKAIINSFDYDDDPYQECKRIKAELNANGWDCSYGLDGMIHSVKPLTI
jgi:hypothetical protein